MGRMFGFHTVFAIFFIAIGAFFVLGKERICLSEIKMRYRLRNSVFLHLQFTLSPYSQENMEKNTYGNVCACVASLHMIYSTGHNATCGQCRKKLGVETGMYISVS
jgi:hypothetical protein